MKKYLPLVLVSVVAVLVGYYLVATAPKSATVALAALNDSGISGSALLKEENGQMIITLTLVGAPAGSSMPAHIHAGECPGIGAVKYSLDPVVDGKSTTSLNGLKLSDLQTMLPLAINVHKSAEEISNYVACGSIQL